MNGSSSSSHTQDKQYNPHELNKKKELRGVKVKCFKFTTKQSEKKPLPIIFYSILFFCYFVSSFFCYSSLSLLLLSAHISTGYGFDLQSWIAWVSCPHCCCFLFRYIFVQMAMQWCVYCGFVLLPFAGNDDAILFICNVLLPLVVIGWLELLVDSLSLFSVMKKHTNVKEYKNKCVGLFIYCCCCSLLQWSSFVLLLPSTKQHDFDVLYLM